MWRRLHFEASVLLLLEGVRILDRLVVLGSLQVMKKPRSLFRLGDHLLRVDLPQVRLDLYGRIP